MIKELKVPTASGAVLDGVLFASGLKNTVLIAITGIHGNFYSNPFYVNFGETLSSAGIDFIYAQTRDAFGQIPIINHLTGKKEVIGSFNEDFAFSNEDIKAYLDFAEKEGYKNIFLAGHSLAANKVIRYLAETAEPRVKKFILLSPSNIQHLRNFVPQEQKDFVLAEYQKGNLEKLLPFELFGWLPCLVRTGYQWLFSDILDNVHLEKDGDFSQIAKIKHTGALLIGTYDRFTYGEPRDFLENINNHFVNPQNNLLIFIEKTGHTYQQKEQEVADKLLALIQSWS